VRRHDGSVPMSISQLSSEGFVRLCQRLVQETEAKANPSARVLLLPTALRTADLQLADSTGKRVYYICKNYRSAELQEAKVNSLLWEFLGELERGKYTQPSEVVLVFPFAEARVRLYVRTLTSAQEHTKHAELRVPNSLESRELVVPVSLIGREEFFEMLSNHPGIMSEFGVGVPDVPVPMAETDPPGELQRGGMSLAVRVDYGEVDGNIFSDHPTLRNEFSSIEKLLGALEAVVTHDETETPLCIGTMGRWGAGKSSFAAMLEKRVQSHGFKTCSIPAWEFSREKNVRIGLVARIHKHIRSEFGLIERLLLKAQFVLNIYTPWLFLSLLAVAGAAVYLKLYTLAIPILGGILILLVSDEISLRFSPAAGIFSGDVGIMQKAKRNVSHISAILQKRKQRFLITLDELDRCPGETVVQILEIVRVLLDYKGIVVMLCMDPVIVSQSIEQYYSRTLDGSSWGSGIMYLEKIIQIPIMLPTHSSEEYAGYARRMLLDGCRSDTLTGDSQVSRTQATVPLVAMQDTDASSSAKGTTQHPSPADLRVLTNKDVADAVEQALQQFTLQETRSALSLTPRRMKRVCTLVRIAAVLLKDVGIPVEALTLYIIVMECAADPNAVIESEAIASLLRSHLEVLRVTLAPLYAWRLAE